MHRCGCHRLCDNRVYQIWRTKFSLFHWLYTQKQKQMTEKSSALHKNQRRGRDWLRCILHRLTPIPSARRRGPCKDYEAISYCVALFVFHTSVCKQAWAIGVKNKKMSFDIFLLRSLCGEGGSRTFEIIEFHKISNHCKLSVYKIVNFTETHKAYFDIWKIGCNFGCNFLTHPIYEH